MAQFLDVKWFNAGTGTCGIIKCKSDHGDTEKYYIGVCKDGNTEQQDIEHIMSWGCRFPNDAGDLLFERRC